MKIISTLVAATAFVAAFGPALSTPAAAQETPSSTRAGAWMCPCPGRAPVPLGNASSCDAVCFGSGGGGGGGGITPQQQMMLNATGAVLKGLMNAYKQQQEEAARARAAAEARERALERQNELKERARMNADAKVLLGETPGTGAGDLTLKDVPPGSNLSFKSVDAPPAVGAGGDLPFKTTDVPTTAPRTIKPPKPLDAAYVKGQADAAACKPENATGYCVGLSPEATTSCAKFYHNGYAVGEIVAKNLLKKAYLLGQSDHAAHKKLAVLAKGVGGACGVHAVEAYNSGYYGKPFTDIGR